MVEDANVDSTTLRGSRGCMIDARLRKGRWRGRRPRARDAQIRGELTVHNAAPPGLSCRRLCISNSRQPSSVLAEFRRDCGNINRPLHFREREKKHIAYLRAVKTTNAEDVCEERADVWETCRRKMRLLRWK